MSFPFDYTIAYFAEIWPYLVVVDGSEQHEIQLTIVPQSDG